MSVETRRGLARLADFVRSSLPPAAARERAAVAVTDTVGVTLAGAGEPAARIVQAVIAEEGGSGCRVLGTSGEASPSNAALANGTAAHALDYDDMCFVSLAHPSAPLVAAGLSAAEVSRASGGALLDAYIVGFELEARLGRLMNPRHYERGWHCTSTLGTIGAAATASRILDLDLGSTGHALAIAASEACGLKENFGTMVKPLHAGLAARNGVLASLLARKGMTASGQAIDGPQGFLTAMDGEHTALDDSIDDLGVRWEILATGITVKLYPSCAATHPSLDAILDLKRQESFAADEVEGIEIGVDSITPTVLMYEHPKTGLEAKFSMQFCAAAAVVYGRVGIDTFETARIVDPQVAALQSRIVMHVDPVLNGAAPPLTQSRVVVRLRDGRVLTRQAIGASGYPDRPVTRDDLAAKFMACALRTLPESEADRALAVLDRIDAIADVRELTELLQP